MRVTLIILMLGLATTGCSQAHNRDFKARTDKPAAQANRPPQKAFTEQEEKKWWQWWKPAPPEPVYRSEALRKAMATNRSTQKPWWDWWTPSAPDPSDPDYVAKQQAWMKYQQKKQLEEFERIRERHEKQMAEQRKQSPAGFRKSRGMLESIQQIQRGR